jgi:S-DNA-T family DNA segregation ATPase FtsK/SpoIIIE
LEVLDVDPDRSEAVDVQDRLGDLSRASVVLVDDVSRIADTPTEDALMTWAAGLRAHGGALVVAGETEQLAGTYRGIVPLVTRSRTGILLQPAGPADGAVLGVAPAGGDLRVPGRGVVVHRGRMTPVQVAVPG